jgi:hypothetical protein
MSISLFDTTPALTSRQKRATGEITETPLEKSGRVRSGKAGAKAQAATLSPKKQRAIAKKAAAARWG